MTVDRAAALIVLILPALTALGAGAWKVFTWAVDRHDESFEAHVMQGQVIQTTSAPDEWATRAYEGLERELRDEQADHARTIHRHRACHESMRAAGMHVPDDH